MRKSKYVSSILIFTLLVSCFSGVFPFGNASTVFATSVSVYVPTDLRMAPASNTDTSVVLVWEKPLNYSNITNYNIYDSNGVLVGKSVKTYYKVLGLVADTTNTFTVRAQDSSGNESVDSNTVKITTRPISQRFNVKDYGVTGDGATIDTVAIQAAIDACTAGGTVYFPTGKYLTGALFLKSNMVVYVDAGAQVIPSAKLSDFSNNGKYVKNRTSNEGDSYASLFNAGVLDNTKGITTSDIKIMGPGTIGDETNGLALRVTYDALATAGSSLIGGNLLGLNNCGDVYLDGLQIRNGMMWTINPIYCSGITAYGLDINTTQHNGDGFDPNSSTNIYILNGTFQTGDDCSAIKSGRDDEGRVINRPSDHIYYRGVTFSGGHGAVVIGSEMSGGVSDIYAEDCIMTPVDVSTGVVNPALKVKTSTTRGGYVKNVQVRDSLVNEVYVDTNYDKLSTPGDYPPDLGNFRFSNLKNSSIASAANIISLSGAVSSATSDNSLKNVQFDNCSFNNATLNTCKNVFFNNCTLTNGISQTSCANIVKDGVVQIFKNPFPINLDFNDGIIVSADYTNFKCDYPDTTTFTKISSFPSSTDQSVEISDDITNGKNYNTVSKAFTTVSSGTVTSQFDFYYAKGLTSGTAATYQLFNLFNTAGYKNGIIADIVTVTGTTGSAITLTNKTAGLTKTIIPSVSVNTWYTIKEVINLGTKTIDVYAGTQGALGTTPIITGAPIYDPTLTTVNLAGFWIQTPGANKNRIDFYLDNIKIDSSAAASLMPVGTSGINITTSGGISAIASKGGTLQLSSSVITQDGSTPPSVNWAVFNPDLTPTDKASISTNGLLTGAKNGDVLVVVSANDSSNVKSFKRISISGQESVSGIAPVNVKTAIGTTPVLPSNVLVKNDDGSATTASVIWDVANKSQYSNAGSFTLHGAVDGILGFSAVANVTVAAAYVKSYQPVIIKTSAGTVPILPDTVTAVLADNTVQKLPVKWDSISPNLYVKDNIKGFTVQGNVDGALLKAAANVSVLPVIISGVQPILVAGDGSGDFKTVQEAINSVQSNSTSRAVIFIKNGLYYEKIQVPTDKTYISLVGESKDGTILTYDDNPNKVLTNGTQSGLGTYDNYSIQVKGNDFSAKNITFSNSSGSSAGQAVAVDVYADRASFENCKILGYQDTLLTRNLTDNSDPVGNYANNNTTKTYRSYYKNCYIAGSVDFIFGNAIAVFEGCEIHSRLGGYDTAAATAQGQKFGYVFNNCKVTAESLMLTVSPGPTSLGRAWRPYAQTVFLNTYMANHIAATGWVQWTATVNVTTSSAFYGEYKTTGAANVSSRVAWSHQLTDAQAAQYTASNIFSAASLINGTEDWDPTLILDNDATLSGITVNGNGISGFNAGTTSYTVELPTGTTLVPIVTATTTTNSAILVVTQASVVPGTATILVTAEDGTTKTYRISFTIASTPATKSNDATLSGITVNGSGVSGFAAGTTSYTVELPTGTTLVPIVTATTTTNSAILVVTQASVVPGTATILVTAEDGTTKTYTIIFKVGSTPTTKSNDATLSEITVNGSGVSGFAAGTTSYTVELPTGTTLVPIVTATTTTNSAILVVTQASVVPGTATILVTAEDGTTKTYTISFTVKASSNTSGGSSATGTTVTVPVVIKTDSNSNAVVTMDSSMIDNNKVNVIQVDEPKTESKVEVQIPASAIGTGTGSFEINTKAVSLSFPTSIIDSSLLSSGGTLRVFQNLMTTTDASALLANAPIGSKTNGKVFTFGMAVYDSNNKIVSDIHNFANGKSVAVTINLSSDDVKGMDTSKISAFYFDTDIKKWTDLGGSFDSAKMTYTFNTTHFTDFTIMEKSDTKVNVNRLSGVSRIETSIAIAKEQYTDKKPDAVVLATAEGFADALAGSGLAYKYNAPLLLVNKTVSDSQVVLDYINTSLSKDKTIYILGETGVISKEISDYLSAQGYKIVRLGGKDRYETNQKIVDNLNVTKGTSLVITTGDEFADALSISSIADIKGFPVLLNGKDNLSASVSNDITNLQPTTVYIVGGVGVISTNIEEQIKNLNGSINIVRLGGKDRYETSMMILDYFNLPTTTMAIATGLDFPDALSGSVLAARKGSGVLLVDNKDITKQKELLSKEKITNIIVFGGEGVISSDIVTSLIQK